MNGSDSGSEAPDNRSETRTAAVILAGSRPGGDPLAQAHDAAAKALVPIAGKAMLAHVTQTLLENQHVGRLHILVQDRTIFDAHDDTKNLSVDQRIEMVTSQATIALSMENLLEKEGFPFPVLITTADNVLLDQAMIAHFLYEAAGSDIAVAVVERDVLMASYPLSQRTWLKLRRGHYSGANLFYFGSPEARKILRYWAEVEQDRKKGWKLLTIFGPWLLFRALLRNLTIDDLARLVGSKLGLKAKVVQMPQAEACIDVDKDSDVAMVEQILAKRTGST